MSSENLFSFLFLLVLWFSSFSEATAWIKSGFWYAGSEFPVPEIPSTLFTHIYFAFAYINTTSFELYISHSDEPYISTFSSTAKKIVLGLAYHGYSWTLVNPKRNTGRLSDGQEIAVKRLSACSRQGLEEFQNEVTLASMLQHVNVLQLQGFCIEREEKILIYEYMPNKSLDFYLYDPVKSLQIDWETRVRIIEGVTQGLLYLQEYSAFTVIHRDLKASNILLDNEMKPKISDFGIAKLFQKDEKEANTGRIVGTYGCVPPEYVKRGIYSRKYDVYSFGVLLLQILGGKKNSSEYGIKNDLNLLEYAYELWEKGNGVDFIDLSLQDDSRIGEQLRYIQVALLCVQEKWEDRPSMLEVYSMLKNETEVLPNPKVPAFSKNKDNDTQETLVTLDLTCSDNSLTISQLIAR